MYVASYVKTGMFFLCLLVLVSCGGGSGGNQKRPPSSVSSSVFSSSLSSSFSVISSSVSSSSNVGISSSVSSSSITSSSSVALMEQTLNFEKTGHVVWPKGLFRNLATGQGTGVISYQSSDKTIADVLDNGFALLRMPGTVTVTATIAADSQYKAATASYTIEVIPDEVSFTAWIGANDTIIDFAKEAAGFEFYRTTQFNCNISVISSCENGEVTTLEAESIVNERISMIDTTLNVDRSAHYTLGKSGIDSGSISIYPQLADDDTIDSDHTRDLVVHDNTLWRLSAGSGGGDRPEVWTSVNGTDWEAQLKSEESDSFRRSFLNAVSFSNKLWLVGGDYSSAVSDEVIYWANATENGLEWIAVETNNIFSLRNHHQSIVFNNKLWVIGGNDGRSRSDIKLKNDVWSSVNGTDWVEESASAGFSAREKHQVVLFNNKLWLIGGNDGEFKNDVWSSIDGVTWVQEAANAEFSPREGHQVINFKGKLWLIGGKTRPTIHSGTSDIWSSTDGVHWVREVEDAVFSRRNYHQVVEFNDQLWLIGGYLDGSTWVSDDGINWRKVYRGTFRMRTSSGI